MLQFFTGVLGAVVFEELVLDSEGYCIFVPVVFHMLSALTIQLNLRDLMEKSGSRGILAGIISGALFGLSVACIFVFLAEGIWKLYFAILGPSADRIELIINAVCITGAALFY